MICVSIGRGRHRHMIAEHRHLVEQGAELVELRLDYIHGKVNLRRLLENRPGPIIATCRRERDGGKYDDSEEERLLLLRQAIAEGAEYVDMEEDVANSIPRFGESKRLISIHDFRKTPVNLDEIHARLCSLDADVVKMATLANNVHDNTRMLQMMRRSKVPTVGICMGDIGIPSRILAGCFGAPFTYATFHQERTLAPGQLSFQQMNDIYHYDDLDSETEIYGVIGDPIGHTLSPLIHNAAFKHLGLNKVYLPFRIPQSDLLTFLESAGELGIKGLSVTIPHKEKVIAGMTKFDGAVKRVGAANTVVYENGDVVGYNTDYRAAMASLEKALGGGTVGDSRLKGKTVLMLGAGGVAKAIAAGLKRRGARLVMASRTLERAEQLAARIGCRAIDWSARHGLSVDVLVNCTPIGMHPNVDETPFDRRHLRPSMVVFDTVYNPENTLLIKDARSQSCNVITGVEMFVEQAVVQFQLFTGLDAPVDVMHDVLRRAIGAARY